MTDDTFVLRTEEEGDQCDFCGGPVGSDVGKDYECGEVRGEPITLAPSTWWACDACAKLIDADNWHALAERAAARVAPAMRALYAKAMRATHEAVRKAMIRKPTPQ